tara:strand:- start:178 stop:666 length:489 start_codon:yes stop_codon:yes gene_type:complete
MSQENKKIKYVGGFYFSEDFSKVALILKNKPDFLKGQINFIGGKIEENETSKDAMKREFQEEANKEINNWTYLYSSNNNHFKIDHYFSYGSMDNIKSMEDEEVLIISVDKALTYPHNDIFRDAFKKTVNYIYQMDLKNKKTEIQPDKGKHKEWLASGFKHKR